MLNEYNTIISKVSLVQTEFLELLHADLRQCLHLRFVLLVFFKEKTANNHISFVHLFILKHSSLASLLRIYHKIEHLVLQAVRAHNRLLQIFGGEVEFLAHEVANTIHTSATQLDHGLIDGKHARDCQILGENWIFDLRVFNLAEEETTRPAGILKSLASTLHTGLEARVIILEGDTVEFADLQER